MALFRRRGKDDGRSVDPDERAPQSGLKYKDLAVLDQLRKAGADLEQPRHALYYLYFASRDAAAAAAEEAREQSFRAAVAEPLPDFPGQWSLTCEQHSVVIDAATVRRNGDFFDAVAARHGGEYDGWEASV